MELEQDGGNMKFYIRKDDKKKIGDAVVDQITYGFYNGKFFWVFLRFKSISNFVHLKDTFFQQYGPGNKRNRFMENYYWGVNDDV